MNRPEFEPKENSMWRHPSQLLKEYRMKLMRLDASPESIAGGLAIGVFVGLLPIVPFHSVTALGLALLFRKSKASALIGTLVSNPLDMVPHYMLLYYLGRKILPGHNPVFDPRHLDFKAIVTDGGDLLAVLMAGGLVLAPLCALAAYYIGLWAVKKYRRSPGGSK